MSTPSRLSARQAPRKPLAPRTYSFVVCAGEREVWRGQAPSIVRALDAARAARPEFKGLNLNVTSAVEPV